MNGKVKEILVGRRLLIVDDRVMTVMTYIDKLHEQGAEVILAETMKEAIDAILDAESKDKKFDFILIDLRLPEIPEELKHLKPLVKKIDMNEGQLLGKWLRGRSPTYPYRYLSAVTKVYDPSIEVEGFSPPLSKSNVSPSELVDKICAVLSPEVSSK